MARYQLGQTLKANDKRVIQIQTQFNALPPHPFKDEFFTKYVKNYHLGSPSEVLHNSVGSPSGALHNSVGSPSGALQPETATATANRSKTETAAATAAATATAEKLHSGLLFGDIPERDRISILKKMKKENLPLYITQFLLFEILGKMKFEQVHSPAAFFNDLFKQHASGSFSETHATNFIDEHQNFRNHLLALQDSQSGGH